MRISDWRSDVCSSDLLGTAMSQAEYPRPWAMVGDTPLRRYKLWPYSGGTRTPMIFHWPRHVDDPGAIRRQFVDVIDIAPTLLEAAGARFDSVVDGVTQIPVAGRSFLPSVRSEEHTSELQSLMRISYAVFCLKKK